MIEFDSPGAFSRHLIRLAAQGEAVTHQAADSAAKVVKDAAQVKIGVYQEQAGPFNAWAPLADRTVADRISKGFSPLEPLLRTGGLRDSITKTVTGSEATVGSTSMIALYQEQGTEHISPRPVLGPAAFEGKKPIGVAVAMHLIAWVAGVSWRRPPGTIRLP